MGECKWSGRIVTGLCRSYLMHTDEHRVHTWHMDTVSLLYFIAYAHMNCRWSFLRLMMGFLRSWAHAQKSAPQVSTLPNVQDGHGRHAPENVDGGWCTCRGGNGASLWEPGSEPQLSCYSAKCPCITSFLLTAHTIPISSRHNTSVGSCMGRVVELWFKSCGGVGSAAHLLFSAMSWMLRSRVVCQSCPHAKNHQKMNALKWKGEFCTEPGL